MCVEGGKKVNKRVSMFIREMRVAKWNEIIYSELSNKHAANLILFEKKFPPKYMPY